MSLSQDLVAGAIGAANYTGLSARTIYHLVYKNALPVVRVGRRMYFRKSELDAVFSSQLAA